MQTTCSPFGSARFLRLLASCCALAWVAQTATVPAAAAGAVQAGKGSITLPTYPWWPPVRHPCFRETDEKNIYPYPMLDNLSREQTNRTYQTVVLENDYLRITFLPELGGKIYDVLDKTTGQPMFYVNHVVKPGLIGMCGAWTSGGVEWNTGPQGHTVGAMQPMEVIILPPEKDGSRSVAIGETERIYGTQWTVVVTLRPDRSFLEERIRIYNGTETVRPYYFWNCTATPNTPGFRFIYPMTLGTDHGSEKFFTWPIDHGKDLSRGTNYQDGSSIFAWFCDQDFFGSYDDGAERGVVAYANHHQVPGKKAWTWGQGGFGRMHQRDLTDSDGPYNEVQTGPLLTQGEVGRLDPCEAVEWKEWWYPIHGIGGFTYANHDVAVNASVEAGQLRLRMMGTGTWRPVDVRLQGPHGLVPTDRTECRISPGEKTELSLPLPARLDAPEVELRAGGKSLARFRVPLDLPVRKPPGPKLPPETAAELAQAGWSDYLFARDREAEAHFRKALEKDAKSVTARTGLAFLFLERDPDTARREAAAALETDPNRGLAHFALASVACAQDESAALDQAWAASLDPVTAIAGRALAAKILLREDRFEEAIAALSESGPWESDSVCRDRCAYAHLMLGQSERATQLARASLESDPLDSFALSVLWLAKANGAEERLRDLLDGNWPGVVDLEARYVELDQAGIALRILNEFYFKSVPPQSRDPLSAYWAQWLAARLTAGHGAHSAAEPGQSGAKNGPTAFQLDLQKTDPSEVRSILESLFPAPANGNPAQGPPRSESFPSGLESVTVLRDAVARNPKDGQAALYLGDLLFHLGRYNEGRALWKRAAELGASPVVAYRALGMASLTLDKDSEAAARYLLRAHAADPADAIVARDLARVLFAQADQAEGSERKKELWSRARDVLKTAFPSGKGRSDFVCLLARAQNRIGDYSQTAQLLDSVRITVWEGSHEAHDLFEEAHLALGKTQLEAGHPTEALAEFDRALEYPENLAIGRLETSSDAPIQRLRAQALTALGQTDAARQALQKAGADPAAKSPER